MRTSSRRSSSASLPSCARSPVHPSYASAGAASSQTRDSSAASANTTANPPSLASLTDNCTNPPSSLPCCDRQLYKPTIFTPMLHPPDRIPVASFVLPENLLALEPRATTFSGCRHGIALFLDRYRREAVLWHPLTGVQHRVAFPPAFQGVGRFDNIIRSATLLCPVDDDQHLHNDCPMSPFKLVFACNGATSTQAFVCVYESKLGVWGDVISIVTAHVISQTKPSVLVGNALCWLLLGGDILEFNFERLTLAVIKKPAGVDVFNVELSFQILRGEDNGLGLAVLAKSEPSIQLWARKSDSDGVVSWLLQTTVQLDQLFSRPLCPDKLVPGMSKLVLMSGYDEDTNVLFLSSVSHDYIIQLQSMQFNYIGRRELKSFRTYHPYTHFYNAAMPREEDEGHGSKKSELRFFASSWACGSNRPS